MALSEENGMVMPVAPMMGGYGNGGFGGWGSDIWLILILLFAFGNGGWGGFGGFGGMGGFAADGAMLYPWMNQAEITTNGFQNQALGTSISGLQNSITSGFGDVQLGIAGVNQNISNGVNGIQNSLCNGFAGVDQSITGAQNALAQQMYTNQIADLERSFAAQTANTAAINGVQSSLQNCCCENRAGIADLKYTVATENCADRTAAAQNTRDIIDAQTRGTQAILDKLCALELDGVKGQLAQAQRENVGLQNQLNMANLAASQAAQTATFQQGLNDEVDALYNRLNSCPVPTTPVYGRTPIFTCNDGNYGCGCGMA